MIAAGIIARKRYNMEPKTPTTDHSDNVIIAAIRLVLALSGLLITYIDPVLHTSLIVYTYIVLSLYTTYSAIVYVLAAFYSSWLKPIIRWSHWIDVGWYTVLVALSHGSTSVFFFGFFFAILVASFRWGFRAGLQVAVVSALLFLVVGVLTLYIAPTFELNRFMLRPVYLVVLGYMISYWGDVEITFKRRLSLLKEISTVSNPRFGVERTVGWLMERLRSFFNADDCLLIASDTATGQHRLYRTDRADPEAGARPQPIPPDLAQQLLVLPSDQTLVYNGAPRFWQRLAQRFSRPLKLPADNAIVTMLAERLATDSFVTVPIRYRNEIYGRLFIIKRRRNAFRESDADFLLQVVEQVTPVIDNIRLVDRLASDAAEEERQKIARDLHDSVIQPYIGLQMGLAAVRQKITTGHANAAQELDKLIDLTSESIADLRSYAHGLRGSGGRESNLVPAIRRFVTKFANATGINVFVEANPDMHINDRLAAEVFQMVAEGLSNIRRHTHATQARIALLRQSDHLILRIENDNREATGSAVFKPRSLTERAAALGGRVRVEQIAGACSAVVIEIPL
jgi:signal transduction histidine kinase